MTAVADPAGRARSWRLLPALLGCAHPGPAAAVTVLAGLLCVAWGVRPGTTVLVVLAVVTSQLSIGWSNDLVDADRDLAVGRPDKPLATGALPRVVVRAACVVAVVVTLPLGLACGATAGLVHVVNTGAGWAYNLGLKSTWASWLPYAVAFGGLPLFVALADPGTGPVRLWSLPAGALLGVGAHLLNALPDLDDDAETGVRGLPHRLGALRSRAGAVAALGVASLVIVAGTRPDLAAAVVALLVVAVLAVVALRGSGRRPFVAAVAIALADVVLLVAS